MNAITNLMQRAPSMTVRDDTIQANLVEIRSLKLQHLVDARAIDLIRSLADLTRLVIDAAEFCGDQPFTELVEKVEGPKMCASGDLDQLCESVSYLTLWQGLQECEVEESVHGRVVRSETVLVVAIVDGDLNADACIDQTNDGRGNPDEVGISSVRCASKAAMAN